MSYNEYIKSILSVRGRFGIPDGEYKERHHITPRCCGGTDDEDNLIDLYAREHFIAHKLLYLENSSNPDICNAYHCLAHVKNNLMESREITPEEYEEAKIAASVWAKTQKVNLGKFKYTNGTDSIFCFEGEQPAGWYRGADEGWKDNISKALKGKKMSPDDPRREKLSKLAKDRHTTLGKKQINNGTKHKFVEESELDTYLSNGWVLGQLPPSEETRRKISDHNKGNKPMGSWTSGYKWYNNGKINVRSKDKPEGFIEGVIKKKNPMHENKGNLYVIVNEEGEIKYINKDEIELWELKGFVRGRKWKEVKK